MRAACRGYAALMPETAPRSSASRHGTLPHHPTAPRGGVTHRHDRPGPGGDGPRPPADAPPHRAGCLPSARPHPSDLPKDTTADDAHRAVERGQLAEGTLVGPYQR